MSSITRDWLLVCLAPAEAEVDGESDARVHTVAHEQLRDLINIDAGVRRQDHVRKIVELLLSHESRDAVIPATGIRNVLTRLESSLVMQAVGLLCHDLTTIEDRLTAFQRSHHE